MHRVLNRSLIQALHWGLISRNPAINQLTPRPRKREMSALTLEQLVRLMEFTKEHPYHALWVVFGTAGLRLGEALGLKWEDIDLVSGRLMVRRALQRHRGKGLVLVPLKTARSYRTVVLTQRAIEALRGHRARNEQRRTEDECWNPQDLVFTSRLGGPLDRGRPMDMLRPLLRAAGLPSIRVHELRHTAATMMLVQGTHPKVVQEMLGHSTVMTTLDTYSHVSPTIHDEAVANLDQLLDQTARNTLWLDGNRAALRRGRAREVGHAPRIGFVRGLARRSRAAVAALRAVPIRRARIPPSPRP
jgi:integrase